MDPRHGPPGYGAPYASYFQPQYYAQPQQQAAPQPVAEEEAEESEPEPDRPDDADFNVDDLDEEDEDASGSEPDNSDDSDFRVGGGSKKRKPAPKAKGRSSGGGAAKKKAAPARRPTVKRKRAASSSDEEDEDDEDDLIEYSGRGGGRRGASGGGASRGSRGGAGSRSGGGGGEEDWRYAERLQRELGAGGSRPRRAAAVEASRKTSWLEDAPEQQPEEEEQGMGGYAQPAYQQQQQQQQGYGYGYAQQRAYTQQPQQPLQPQPQGYYVQQPQGYYGQPAFGQQGGYYGVPALALQGARPGYGQQPQQQQQQQQQGGYYGSAAGYASGYGYFAPSVAGAAAAQQAPHQRGGVAAAAARPPRPRAAADTGVRGGGGAAGRSSGGRGGRPRPSYVLEDGSEEEYEASEGEEEVQYADNSSDSLDEEEPDFSDEDEMLQRMALGLRSHPRKLHHAAAGSRGTRGGSQGSSGREYGYGYGGQASEEDWRRTSGRAARVSYAEGRGSGSEAASSSDEKKKTKAVPYVLLPDDQLAALDDEVERVIMHREAEGVAPVPGDPWASREFYVKWARFSYLHCSWDTRETLSQLKGYKRVLNYMRKADEREANRGYLSREEQELADVQQQMEEQLVQEYMTVERVISEKPDTSPEAGGSGCMRYLVKWKGLPYSEGTWERLEDLSKVNATALIDEYQDRERRIRESRKTVDAQRRAFVESGTRAFIEQPDYLKGGTLRDYQLAGLNWLIYSWSRGNNCILADEMGLGKTIQCVSMIGYLSEVQQIAGPFLVVVPLSTVPNWIKEFRKWVPSLNAIVYVGDGQSREILRQFEFYTGRPVGRMYKFDVLITTYEMVIKDSAVLRPIRWAYMMVDEAHRLKNEESALYKELFSWSFKSKLLVTGTPLQNNIKELWALMHFLEPAKFPSCERFEEDYSLQNPEQVARLHAVLRPHLLRRVIKDVEKSLPPKNERILRVGMTPLQKQYYKWILTRNYKELNKGSKGQVTLLNIIMDLKKCCNHPFLFESAEENYRGRDGDDQDVATRLAVTSGKMVLLEKLLRRLYETGHRVLVFSQMVRVLDIISDYMRKRGYQHQRLDGSTPAHARHQAMEHFNAPGSPDFAFLLSTRAGGLGINLATADTVIIFDSDWNPQNDLQAMSRAHRIGQKDTVNIYRFVTSGSVEEDILERAKQKMVLDHLVIQRMDTSGRTVLDPTAGGGGGAQTAKQMFGKDELAAILRFGAEELFKEDDAATESRGQALYEEDIDAILARAEVVHEGHGEAAGKQMDELLGAFNVATFKTAGEEDDAAFWSRLIPEDQRPKQEAAVQEDPGIRSARLKALEGSEGSGAGATAGGSAKKAQRRKDPSRLRGRAPSQGGEPGPAVDGCLVRVDRWPAPEAGAAGAQQAQQQQPGEEAPLPDDWPQTLSRRDATIFARAARHHGLLSHLDAVSKEVWGASGAGAPPPDALRALWHGLLRACERAVAAQQAQQQHTSTGAGATGAGGEGAAAAGGEGGGASAARIDFFGHAVNAVELLGVVRQMGILDGKLAGMKSPAQTFRLAASEIAPTTQWMKHCGWAARDDAMLLLGVYKYGVGAWDRMALDEELHLADKLAVAAAERVAKGGASEAAAAGLPPVNNPGALPKASHLETRAYALLRQLEKAQLRSAGGGFAAGAHRARPPSRSGAAGAAGPLAATRVRPGSAGVAAAAGGKPPRPGSGAQGAAAPAGAAASAASAAAGMRGGALGTTEGEGLMGAEMMVIVRKLRTLQRKGGDMDKELVLNKTKKYLAAIGDRIEEVAATVGGGGGGGGAHGVAAALRPRLWGFISAYTENSMSGEKLEAVYHKLQAKDHHAPHPHPHPHPHQQQQQHAAGHPPAAAAAPHGQQQPATGQQPAAQQPAGAAPAAGAVQQQQQQQPLSPRPGSRQSGGADPGAAAAPGAAPAVPLIPKRPPSNAAAAGEGGGTGPSSPHAWQQRGSSGGGSGEGDRDRDRHHSHSHHHAHGHHHTHSYRDHGDHGQGGHHSHHHHYHHRERGREEKGAGGGESGSGGGERRRHD